VAFCTDTRRSQRRAAIDHPDRALQRRGVFIIRAFWLLVNLREQSGIITSRGPPQARDHGGTTGQTEMEWEEALLMAWGGEMPPHPAGYYRQQAARARRVAEGATTRAVKARLLDDAVRYDELAVEADRAETEAEER